MYWVLSYGSNNVSTVLEKLNLKTVDYIKVRLFGYKLVFFGIASKAPLNLGCSPCTIIKSKNSTDFVDGLIYHIPEHKLKYLHMKEGYSENNPIHKNSYEFIRFHDIKNIKEKVGYHNGKIIFKPLTITEVYTYIKFYGLSYHSIGFVYPKETYLNAIRQTILDSQPEGSEILSPQIDVVTLPLLPRYTKIDYSI